MSPSHHEHEFKNIEPVSPINEDPPCYVEIDDAKTTSILSPKLQAILYAQTNGQASVSNSWNSENVVQSILNVKIWKIVNI